MEDRSEYKRTFLMFDHEDAGYGFTGEPSGYIKLETRGRKGRLSAFVQNLKESRDKIGYSLYLLICNGRQTIPLLIGKISLTKNRGDIQWDFDAENVAATGHSIDKFNAAVILAEYGDSSSKGISCPLAAYRDKKVDWRPGLKKFLYPAVRDMAVPEPALNVKREIQDIRAVAAKFDDDSGRKEYTAGMPEMLKTVPKPERHAMEACVIKSDDDVQDGHTEERHAEEPAEEQKAGAVLSWEEDQAGVFPESHKDEGKKEAQEQEEWEQDEEELEQEDQEQEDQEAYIENEEEREQEEWKEQEYKMEYPGQSFEGEGSVNPHFQPERTDDSELSDIGQHADETDDTVKYSQEERYAEYDPVKTCKNYIEGGCPNLNGIFQASQNGPVQTGSTGFNPCLKCSVACLGKMQPNVAQPDIMQQNMTQPYIAQPNMPQPGMIQLNMAQPGMIQPNMAQPDMAQPDMVEQNMDTTAGKIDEVKNSFNKYFEPYNPFRSRKRNYKWWKVNSPVHFNNVLYQCNIRTPLLFNPVVMMAHYKYRHLIAGIFADRLRNREYIVCGVPGVYNVDERPFGEMCLWVQLEGYKPRYGAFGYWLVYIDPKNGKLISIN